MNKVLLLGLIVALVFISGCSPLTEYTIEGDSVIVDNDDLYLEVSPHTVSSSGWAETEFQSKQYSGDIDFVFGFPTDVVRPTAAQIYNPHVVNETYSYTCDYDFAYTVDPNYFWCYEILEGGNQSGNRTIFEHWFDTGNIQEKTAYWHENTTVDWQDWNPDGVLDYEYADMTKWYYAQNKHVDAGETYRLRYYLDVPFNPDGSEGKYTLALKPSSESIQEAIANEHFYMLDPWWNGSYAFKYNLNITIAGELAVYNDPIIEVGIGTFNGSWDSLEVVVDDSFTYEWEWAWHDITDTNGNSTKAIRFVASNITFTNNTAHTNFSIYIPANKISQNNDSIFVVAEDWNDGDSNGWDIDTGFSINFQDDGWVNVSESGVAVKNATFEVDTIDDRLIYTNFKSRIDTNLLTQSFYFRVGNYTLENVGTEGGILLGSSNGDTYRSYNGTAFRGVLTDADDINVTQQANISTYGDNMYFNWTVRKEGTLRNNTAINLLSAAGVAGAGKSDVVTKIGLTLTDNVDPAGVYLDDIYLGFIPFSVYFANTTITYDVEAFGVALANPTISPAIETSTTNVGCNVVYTENAALDGNISFAWFKNNVINETYNSTFYGVNSSSTVNATNITTETFVKGDVWTCGVWATAVDGSGNATGNTSSTVTGVVPSEATTKTPANQYFTDESLTTLTCSGATDDDGDTIYYEFWNNTGTSPMQNTTATTYAWTHDGIPASTGFNWSCRTHDSDGDGNWSLINRSIITVGLGNCSDDYTEGFLNFTYADETTLNPTNASYPATSIDYTIGGYTNNLVISNTTATNFTQFCFEPYNTTITADISHRYENPDYPQRLYGVNGISLSNTTTSTLLYLLATGDGIYATFAVQNDYGDAIEGVAITVERQFGGLWTQILSSTTGDSGTVQFWVNPNYDHRFTFIKSGYASQSLVLAPTETTYVVTMSSGTSINYTSSTDGMLWSMSPNGGYLDSKQTNFSFTAYANYSNLQGLKFSIKNASNMLDVANVSATYTDATTEMISLMYTPLPSMRLKGVYYVSTNISQGYSIVDADHAWWTAIENITSQRTTTSLFSRLTNLTEFGPNDSIEQEYSRVVFFFLTITILLGLLCFFTGWEFSNPAFGMYVLLIIFWMASYSGFFYNTDLVTSTYVAAGLALWINQYIMVLIMSLVVFAYTINTWGRKS